MSKPTRKSSKRSESPPLAFEPDTSAGPFTARHVRDTEEMLKQRFTPTFLEFLKKQNGGVPKARFFKLGRNEKVVERFLSLIPNYNDHELGWFDIGVTWSQIEDRLNEHLVPFAALFPGDFLCFDYEDRKVPRVVLWDHERSDDDDPVTTHVADSFEEFLLMLKEDTPAAPARKKKPAAPRRKKQ